MLLLVGLGNPGAEYTRNRHNIGFMAADAIARRHSLGRFRAKFSGDIAEGTVGRERVLVLKPKTFMNEAGRSVAAAARFYRILPPDIIVLHDELDLAVGRLRVKDGGGHAGHNGLRDIHAYLGADYRRVRLGIGHPGDKERVTAHVLQDFTKADGLWVEALLGAVAENFPLLVERRDAEFVSCVALALKPPKSKAKPAPERPKRLEGPEDKAASAPLEDDDGL
jgi:PTH1 family peptidyl-tRNA hydrolase